jgi:haloalkane dehalogenase
LLHGNPTWSYLWRNVIPHLEGHGRCIAFDCIGMGRSGKPTIAYRFSEHLAYLAAAIEQLELTDITLVTHDWGVVLGLALCRLMPQRVRALAFMEGHIHPIASWEEMEPGARALFSQLRTEDVGRRMVVDENIFVETILPSGVRRRLTPVEMDAYREPYHERSARLLLWQWARSIPIAGEPPEMVEAVAANQQYLASSALPKLLLYAQPGAVIGQAEVEWCRRSCLNLTALDLGPGIHFLPEDHPDSIGEAVVRWMETRAL